MFIVDLSIEMDKSQVLHMAADAFQLLTNVDVKSAYNPLSILFSGKLVHYAALSVVLVASSYSLGIFFEKVLPNVPLLKKNLLGIDGKMELFGLREVLHFAI